MADNGARKRPTPMSATVLRTERLSVSMVRVVLELQDKNRFTPSEFTDSYVKVLFLHPDGDYPRPVDVDQIRTEMPSKYWPRLRTYTVRNFDAENAALTLDFVVHGDEGVAGPWAANTQPGDEVLLLGPGGGYSPDPSADWHLMIGDESVLPAIATALEALPATATAHIFVEVHGPEDEIPMPMKENAALVWIHRGIRPVGEALVEAVTAEEFPPGRVHAFVHGEAGFVKQIRRFLRLGHNLDQQQLSISGYWRVGADDEGWRAIKKDWNREVEEEEHAAGIS
ncbi:MAG TPA: siderophore-interacting protein [Jatrophihabitans sp.]|jgi:NADPH-dependent ferric siderophore reductase